MPLSNLDMVFCAKHAAAANQALPGSSLSQLLGRHQKVFNAVKPPKPMKFKGESVSGLKPPKSSV